MTESDSRSAGQPNDMDENKCSLRLLSAADPGFPRRGRQPIIWPNYAENCMKMKKIRWGRVCKILLCRSATGLNFHVLGLLRFGNLR